MKSTGFDNLLSLLRYVYGDGLSDGYIERFKTLVESRDFQPRRHEAGPQDIVLIAYGDHISRPGQQPLAALHDFCSRHTDGLVNSVHLLPHYPWTSDDGFSVSDYTAVDAVLGSWQDVEALADDFKLMFDAVFNHSSVAHPWFKAYLAGDSRYANYYVDLPADTDVTAVTRPRTSPLLTAFQAGDGTLKHVWTTFSADQADLNYAEPEVLYDIIAILLEYVGHGAQLIRLDAATYMWKDPATSSASLPKTHAIVQIMRQVLLLAAPWVWIVTETNVPHDENLSYFGDGRNEAQMIYNFALPALTVYSLQTGSAAKLTAWAAGLRTPSAETSFFNFTASHDGIGLRGVAGILNEAEITAMCDTVTARGGRLSMKTNPDGSQGVYEMNASFFNAVADPALPVEFRIDQFICSQAIALSLRGVPGIYLHSLLGTENWLEGVVQTGRSRTINRRKLDAAEVERQLTDPASLTCRVYGRYAELLRVRSSEPAFSPQAPQLIVDMGAAVFAVERHDEAGGRSVLALHNVSAQPVTVPLEGGWQDLLNGGTVSDAVQLEPFAVSWLLRPSG